MTDKPTPTDAELKAMWQLHAADIGGIFCYARAVLEKWGTPARAAEPFCWHWENTFNGGTGTVKKNHETLGINMSHPDYKWTALYTAPQPVAREQLPKFLALKFHARRDKKATVTLLFPGHEAADAWVRGIKGGQHGEATPQPTQPVAREPLTDEQIQDLLLCGNPTDEEMRLIRIGWDAAMNKGANHDK